MTYSPDNENVEASEVFSVLNCWALFSPAMAEIATSKDASATQVLMRDWHEKFFIDQREPEVSRRNNVTAFEISFIITDSDPSRSTPCSEPSDAAEIISPRHTSVEAFPSTLTGHI